jgi:cell division septation protein DedD
MEKRNYIAELLEQHDCVIIPGLGGFVGSYAPATIHPVYHTFQPPYKKILFNINLRQNDGLLANHIAQSAQIPYAEANEQVWKYSEECQQMLSTRKQIHISNVGRLYTGHEGTIHFDQDTRFNHLPESYGFQPFFSIPVNKEIAIEHAVIAAHSIHQHSKFSFNEPLKWAAALALPVGVAFLLNFSGLGKLNTKEFTYADILSDISVMMLPSQHEKMPVKTIRESPKKSPETIKTETPVAVTPSEPAPAPVVSDVSNPFAVIVGAFRIEENATNLVSMLRGQGIPAIVYDRTSGGLYRVATGTFRERNEAIANLQQMKTQGYPGAWLLSK